MFKKLLLCAALCAVNSTVYADNIALLVGISDYQNKDIKDLDGPVEDVAALKKVLIDQWGFKAGNIQTLINGQATQKSILNALENLEKRSKAGDSVFVYFSGHGTSAKDNTIGKDVSSILPSTSGAFIPVDFNVNNNKLSVNDLKKSLIVGRWHLQPIFKKLEQSRSVFVVMDSCYSGNAVRSYVHMARLKRHHDISASLAGDAFANSLDIDNGEFTEPPYPYKNVVFISASAETESAEDLGRNKADLTLDGKPHGAFTNAFLKVLNDKGADTNGDKQISYSELVTSTRSILKQDEVAQTPQILPTTKDDNTQLADKPLFSATQVEFATSPKIDTVVYVQLKNGLKAPQLEQINGVSTSSSSTLDFIVSQSGSGYLLQTAAGDTMIDKASITTVAERIRAEVWLKQLLKPLKPTTSMRLETNKESKGNNFIEGETFVFQTRIQSPSYLLLFNIDVQGRVSVLYPYLASELKRLSANTLLSVPSGVNKDEFIMVQAPFGVDTTVAVALPNAFALEDVKNIAEVTVNHPSIKKLTSLIQAQPTAAWSQLQARTYPRKN